MKVAWYYFGNGKEIINEAKNFWKKHEKFADDLDTECFYRMKDGDDFDDFEEYAVKLAKNYGITDFKKSYLKYR